MMSNNQSIVNSSAHSLGTSSNQDLLSILISTSPIFLTLICLSFLFILYKNINKFFIKQALTETQVKKEINYLTFAYAIFISSVSGFMANMYLNIPISIFISCCILYVQFILIRIFSSKK